MSDGSKEGPNMQEDETNIMEKYGTAQQKIWNWPLLSLAQ